METTYHTLTALDHAGQLAAIKTDVAARHELMVHWCANQPALLALKKITWQMRHTTAVTLSSQCYTRTVMSTTSPVQSDTSIPDLHVALADYYLPDLGERSQPTAEGAVENSPEFKQRAQQAWEKAAYGLKANVESGFEVGKTGVGPLQTHESAPGGQPKDNNQVSHDAVGVLHKHLAIASGYRSLVDIEGWVVAVDPAGKVTQVFNRSDWMKRKTQ